MQTNGSIKRLLMKSRNIYFSSFIVMILIVSGCASTTPLIKASASGDYLSVKKLINEGTNINEPDSNGATSLMHAIWKGKTDVAKYLIESGANLKIKDKKGYDALFYAIDCGKVEIVKNLIDKGADLESKDSTGLTPLIDAILYERNTDIIKLLIERGANLNAKTSEGETALNMLLSSKSGVVDELIRSGKINLWLPEAGKARIFFVGSSLWDYIKLTIGKETKWLNRNMFTGFTFFDVDSGKQEIHAYVDKFDSGNPTSSIDAKTGQAYFFKVSQDMKKRVAHYALIKLSSIVVTPLTEVEAKELIKDILKSKELK